ncbi:MAG TPA: non-homologous end-joining DNA ligase [Streptosporangiaceae bacterium]|nr:non-homologous end-joining DNA ligase [Streptosporangiaceae bacterium]
MTNPWLEPELATLTKERFSDPGWLYERKFDGERCLAYRSGGKVALVTRNALDVSATYPEVRDALLSQRASDFVVDGEVVAFDGDVTSFGRLQQRLGVRAPRAELLRQVPVVYFVFDVLRADGRDVRRLPLRERKPMLAELLDSAGSLRLTEHRQGDGSPFWDEACAKGWEGLIAKRADAPYRAGRSRDWLKFKCLNSQEFVIGGYTEPQRSRVGLGALLIGYYDGQGRLVSAGKVGTGFDTATLVSLHGLLSPIERDSSPFGAGELPGSSVPRSSAPRTGARRSGVHWVEPRLVAQIGFSEWTAGGQLRHPRFEGLRQDKDPASVVREIPS